VIADGLHVGMVVLPPFYGVVWWSVAAPLHVQKRGRSADCYVIHFNKSYVVKLQLEDVYPYIFSPIFSLEVCVVGTLEVSPRILKHTTM
jgi:hypothetical protein